MTNAEHQKAHRARVAAKLACATAMGTALREIERLTADRLDTFGKRIHDIARAAAKQEKA